MGKRTVEPRSILYIFQHGASEGRNTDLTVLNQNAVRMALLPETGTVDSPRTMGSWTDLVTSRMLPTTSFKCVT
jgi:hypothetical protein